MIDAVIAASDQGHNITSIIACLSQTADIQEKKCKFYRTNFLEWYEAMKYLKWIPGLGPVISGMKDITDSIGKGMKAIFGDATFLSSCLEKSANNGERGCVMKYDYITHDETYDEWYPKSCELQ